MKLLNRIGAAALLLLFLCLQGGGLQRCATPTAPTGGPRDSLGPVLIVEETTPNFQTNFRPEEIRLTFDEWVVLDPQQEIIISPPIELGPDNRPQLQRRSLVIPLEGIILRDSVTYVVNIGAAVKDLNEGNPTQNLRFVFATGPVLDTASVSATIVDAFSGEAVEGAALTLYSNLADTAVFTENPTYFAQTDEEGRVTVSNVKPGQYRVVSLLRGSGATNYFADFSGFYAPLATGFLDTVVTVTDRDNVIGTLRLSEVPVVPRITDIVVDNYGVIKIGLNQAAERVDIVYGRDYVRSDLGDTIRLFYREAAPDTLLIGRDSVYSDTLYLSGQDAGTEPITPLSVVQTSARRVNPREGVLLTFNRPVETVDTARVRLLRDTLRTPVGYRYAVDSLDPTRLSITAGFNDGVPYELIVLPDAITDWYGAANADTLAELLTVTPVESLGDLTIRLQNLNGASDYLLRLLDTDGEVIDGSRRSIRQRFDYEVTYRGLRPATYRMELIYDTNGNGRYDSGDLQFGTQPEVVRRFEIEPLRANWEVEKIIDLENN